VTGLKSQFYNPETQELEPDAHGLKATQDEQPLGIRGFSMATKKIQKIGHTPRDLSDRAHYSGYSTPQAAPFHPPQSQYPTQQHHGTYHGSYYPQAPVQPALLGSSTNWHQQHQPTMQASMNPFDQSLNDRSWNKHGLVHPPQPQGHFTSHMTSVATKPTEFVHSYPFDENGALYWLGSYGKRKVWQNPHRCGQVHAYASSIGQGSAENIVGRVPSNTRTCNEPYSYFAVDLGEGRNLIPTCYSIMNRNSSTNVMMNWNLEGSVDGREWIVLDQRTYLPDGPDSYQFDEDQKLLKKKGGASSWGLARDFSGAKSGFRHFRIVQTGRNSSGNDNLALSCFELYGRPVGRW
jgi:hypothetical protein